jgi:hypothetical protein
VTRPPKAAFAKPVPIDCATSATVTGPGYWRCEPSGNVICTIGSISWEVLGTENQKTETKNAAWKPRSVDCLAESCR